MRVGALLIPVEAGPWDFVGGKPGLSEATNGEA